MICLRSHRCSAVCPSLHPKLPACKALEHMQTPVQAGCLSGGACLRVQRMGWLWAQLFSTVCVYFSSVYMVWLQVSLPTPSAWSALLCLGLLMTPKSSETQCGRHLSLQAALTPLAEAVATSTLPGVVFIGGEGVSFTSVSPRCLGRAWPGH